MRTEISINLHQKFGKFVFLFLIKPIKFGKSDRYS
jgi:hypothetical protein